MQFFYQYEFLKDTFKKKLSMKSYWWTKKIVLVTIFDHTGVNFNIYYSKGIYVRQLFIVAIICNMLYMKNNIGVSGYAKYNFPMGAPIEPPTP